MTPCSTCARREACGHEPAAPDRCPDWTPERPSSFRLVRAGDLELSRPDWLVRGMIERDSFGVLSAPFSSFKSFIALELALATATGTDALGRATKQGPVIYIAGEGQAGLTRRRRAWSIARGIDTAASPLFFSTVAANLSDDAMLAEIATAVRAVAMREGSPALLVVDTWSRNLGADENSSLDTARAVAALDAIRRPYGASALIVHHEGWTPGRTRGSTVLMAAADFAYTIKREGNAATLEASKMKDGAAPEPIAFDIEDVELGLEDEDGEPMRSGVVRLLDALPAAAKTKAASGKNQRLALESLRQALLSNQANLNAKGLNPSGARVPLDQWHGAMETAGMNRRRIPETIASLRAKEIIFIDSGGFVMEGPPNDEPLPFD